jgi:quinoprotein dehydrogenase-associated probable ABC transporter substrate-binding protein
VLSVCADPANLPYSNQKQQGFENKIAAVLAADLNSDVSFFWFPQHANFLRRTLLGHNCDVLIAVPTALPGIAVTKPYFASSYVAVTRSKDANRFTSFDDKWLNDARIGLQMVGTDTATTPPVSALSARHLNQHIVGFQMWADSGVENPQGKIIDAVADNTIDIALVWGPFAGYFAKPHGTALTIAPILSDPKVPTQTYVFPMSVGVRKDDIALRDRLQLALDRHAPEIAAILHDDGIPTVPVPPATAPDTPRSPPQTH